MLINILNCEFKDGTHLPNDIIPNDIISDCVIIPKKDFYEKYVPIAGEMPYKEREDCEGCPVAIRELRPNNVMPGLTSEDFSPSLMRVLEEWRCNPRYISFFNRSPTIQPRQFDIGEIRGSRNNSRIIDDDVF